PGLYVVYLPFGDYIAVSRKMKSEEERLHWKQFGEEKRIDTEGLIFRTACEEMDENAVFSELIDARKKYELLCEKVKNQKAPSLLLEANNFVERIVENYRNEDIEEIVIDDATIYRQLVRRYGKEKVTYYTEKENIFSF